jgi:transposase
MGRRFFTTEFKVEAVRLVRERGVRISQAAHDLGIHQNVLRKWIKDMASNPKQAFPGRGKQRADDAEVSRLRQELARTKAERDILKKAIAFFAKEPR